MEDCKLAMDWKAVNMINHAQLISIRLALILTGDVVHVFAVELVIAAIRWPKKSYFYL